MTPITLNQKSRILDFLSKGGHIKNDEMCNKVWDAMAELDSGTASDVIKAFYDRNNGVGLSQLRHLKIIA